MSYRELWSASKLLFPMHVAVKLSGVRVPTPVLSPLSTTLQELDWDALSDRARDQLGKCVGGLKSVGFEEALLYREDWRGLNLDCCSVALLDEPRTTLTIATYTCFRIDFVERYGEHIDAVFYSFADDGSVLVTRSSKYIFEQPPEYETVHLPNLLPQDVAALHAKRLAERTKSQPYRDTESWRAVERSEVPARALALSRRETQYHVERGVYFPVTPAEADDVAARSLPAPRMSPRRVLLLWGVLIAAMLILANVANIASNTP